VEAFVNIDLAKPKVNILCVLFVLINMIFFTSKEPNELKTESESLRLEIIKQKMEMK